MIEVDELRVLFAEHDQFQFLSFFRMGPDLKASRLEDLAAVIASEHAFDSSEKFWRRVGSSPPGPSLSRNERVGAPITGTPAVLSQHAKPSSAPAFGVGPQSVRKEAS